MITAWEATAVPLSLHTDAAGFKSCGALPARVAQTVRGGQKKTHRNSDTNRHGRQQKNTARVQVRGNIPVGPEKNNETTASIVLPSTLESEARANGFSGDFRTVRRVLLELGGEEMRELPTAVTHLGTASLSVASKTLYSLLFSR
jgi:hypothetical protein